MTTEQTKRAPHEPGSRPVTDLQLETLKLAKNRGIRAFESGVLPSLVRRGLMKRGGGRPGVIFYFITDAGRAAIDKANKAAS